VKPNTRVKAWRETEETATIISVDTVLSDGKFAFWIRFDGDAEDDHYLYSEDGLEKTVSAAAD